MQIAAKSSARVLEPYDRISEILFGLIMVLTFTGSLSVAQAGREDVRTMLAAALGCNLAWGIIDGIFYLMGCRAEENRALSTLHAVRAAPDAASAQALVAEAMPEQLGSFLRPEELAALAQRIKDGPQPPARARLGKEAWLGAVAVFLLVFVSTLPVALPFLLMQNVMRAMRVSNAIAVVLLFLTGCAYGRLVGHRSLPMGIGMVVVGSALVALTMALGG